MSKSIYELHWDRWRPTPAKLGASQFMEKDIEGSSRWFDITPGKWIQGLVAHWDRERRIYVVIITPETEYAAHERWPRILSG